MEKQLQLTWASQSFASSTDDRRPSSDCRTATRSDTGSVSALYNKAWCLHTIGAFRVSNGSGTLRRLWLQRAWRGSRDSTIKTTSRLGCWRSLRLGILDGHIFGYAWHTLCKQQVICQYTKLIQSVVNLLAIGHWAFTGSSWPNIMKQVADINGIEGILRVRATRPCLINSKKLRYARLNASRCACNIWPSSIGSQNGCKASSKAWFIFCTTPLPAVVHVKHDILTYSTRGNVAAARGNSSCLQAWALPESMKSMYCPGGAILAVGGAVAVKLPEPAAEKVIPEPAAEKVNTTALSSKWLPCVGDPGRIITTRSMEVTLEYAIVKLPL